MSFEREMKKFAAKTKQRMNDVVAGTCMRLTYSIVVQTPVDTGIARGNWQSSINNVDVKIINTPDPSGNSSIQKGYLTAKKSVGEIFYLVNNLPYIRPLEYGHSTQAPHGMVGISVRQFRKFIREELEK